MSGTAPPGPRDGAGRDAHDAACPVGTLLRLLGKPYLLDVLAALLVDPDRPLRFVDIEARVATTPNTLTARLRELERAQIVLRTAYPEIPPRVEYRVTPKGAELKRVFDELHAWSHRHPLPAERRTPRVT